jgi:hypothetical protein
MMLEKYPNQRSMHSVVLSFQRNPLPILQRLKCHQKGFQSFSLICTLLKILVLKIDILSQRGLEP